MQTIIHTSLPGYFKICTLISDPSVATTLLVALGSKTVHQQMFQIEEQYAYYAQSERGYLLT